MKFYPARVRLLLATELTLQIHDRKAHAKSFFSNPNATKISKRLYFLLGGLQPFLGSKSPRWCFLVFTCSLDSFKRRPVLLVWLVHLQAPSRSLRWHSIIKLWTPLLLFSLTVNISKVNLTFAELHKSFEDNIVPWSGTGHRRWEWRQPVVR